MIGYWLSSAHDAFVPLLTLPLVARICSDERSGRTNTKDLPRRWLDRDLLEERQQSEVVPTTVVTFCFFILPGGGVLHLSVHPCSVTPPFTSLLLVAILRCTLSTSSL